MVGEPHDDCDEDAESLKNVFLFGVFLEIFSQFFFPL